MELHELIVDFYSIYLGALGCSVLFTKHETNIKLMKAKIGKEGQDA